jgi:hypothetical protein
VRAFAASGSANAEAGYYLPDIQDEPFKKNHFQSSVFHDIKVRILKVRAG